MNSRDVLFEILYRGLVDIRAYSGGQAAMSSDDRELVNSISNLLHNLPHQLQAAATEEEFNLLLEGLLRTKRSGERAWLLRHSENIGLEL